MGSLPIEMLDTMPIALLLFKRVFSGKVGVMTDTQTHKISTYRLKSNVHAALFPLHLSLLHCIGTRAAVVCLAKVL